MPYRAIRRRRVAPERQVLSAIQLYPAGAFVSIADVICETGLDPEVVDRAAKALAERGEIRRDGSHRRGWAYRIPPINQEP